MDSLSDAPILSTLDADSSYCQVEIAKGDRAKLTFASYQGLFQLICMPLRLKSALGPLQRAKDVILSTFHWKFTKVYLHDVVTFSKSSEAHIKRVKHVLTLLGDAGVIIKLKKGEFF